MDRICRWNIRGLNWPNKLEDVKIFFCEKKIGLVGLLDTKVKEKNVEKIQEMRSGGPYFTWINKIIWTRIDRVFVNAYWYDQFDFSQAIYMANSFSDHRTMVIDTPGYPRPKPTFQFCDMWIRDTSFCSLVTSMLPVNLHLGPYQRLKLFLRNTKTSLQQLNKCHFTDLKNQQSTTRAELERNQNLLLADPNNLEL
ncbi:hypothetical protein Cgig2_028769 [Carnegiea gigantea]|uniref:Uncharacterized protein n=1 Tax=Carnegiea gigantea TaxID=171969 RepID=A0A9Q1GGC9_9CARY|nr:hypothetical protein Cgig2_028769 [Carnegiea gigantea]